MLGRTISHYKITEKLGEGGMGVVYKAEDTKLERPVALKFLAAHAIEDPEHKARFVREAKAAARLDHPNVCSVYEIDEAEGQTFLAMAYLEGQTVKAKIAERPLKLDEAFNIAIQTAQGLTAAHQKGIVHRDIKPANLMLTEEGQVKIMDFGLAQSEAQSKLTKTGSTLGTVAYMSPEQALGRKVDHRTDIWSLGVVLYEMITGQLPFQGEVEAAVAYSVVNEEPVPTTALRTGVPIEVDRVIGRALAKDRQERYQHIDELLVDLRGLEKQESGTGRPAPPPKAVGRRRQTGRYAALAALAAILIVGAVWRFEVFGPSPQPPRAPFEIVPLTSYPGIEEHPSFSPDGNQVAFSWNGQDQDNYDIYVQLVGSSTPLRLTTDPASDGSPGFSPDGRQIAFLRARPEGVSEVLLVPPIGGPERKLAEIHVGRDQFDTSLSWSPEGKSLLVRDRSSPEEQPGVFVLSIDNSEKRRLTSSPETTTHGDRTAVFSPDGRMVAFERSRGWGVSDIHLVPTANGQPTRLTFDKGNPEGLTWTADGNEIIFSRRGALWRISASGGTPQRLMGIPGRQIQPVISLTGRRLAYVERTYNTDIWRVDTQAPLDRRLPQKFIASTRLDASPQFSPDGKRIVFFSNRSGSGEIWVCDSDGANPFQLTSIGRSGTPRWSPDGQSIAFDSYSRGNYDIYIVSSAGGSHRRITTNPTWDTSPSWSRDGRWIYFFSDRTGENQVWKVPVGGEGDDGSLAVRVTKHGGEVPFESTDGKYVFYFGSSQKCMQLDRG